MKKATRRGYTLVELLIAIAATALGLAFAVAVICALFGLGYFLFSHA